MDKIDVQYHQPGQRFHNYHAFRSQIVITAMAVGVIATIIQALRQAMVRGAPFAWDFDFEFVREPSHSHEWV
jgi:hypothetical protein